MFDSRLTWKDHTKHINDKAIGRTMKITSLNCFERGLNPYLAILIYKQVIRPQIEYRFIIKGDAAQTHKKKMEKIQYKALCNALGVNNTTIGE